MSIRVWARDEHDRPARLAICTTYRPEPATAVLEAIRAGRLDATPAVVIGNRPACRAVADRFGVDWHMIGDDRGRPVNSNRELERVSVEISQGLSPLPQNDSLS